MAKNFAGIAERYARDVVDQKIPACRWVRLSCQPHLNDLLASKIVAHRPAKISVARLDNHSGASGAPFGASGSSGFIRHFCAVPGTTFG